MAIVDMVDTTADTVDIVDTATAKGTSARGPLMPNPRLRLMPPLSLNPKPRLMPTTVMVVIMVIPDTTVDTMAILIAISASGPLMLNPRLMPTSVMVDTTVVDTTVVDTDTDTATDTSARGPLMPNPRLRLHPTLTTDTDMAVPTDTTVVDTDTVVDTTGDKLFIQDQVIRNLSNLANFDKFSSFFHQSLPSNIYSTFVMF